MSDVKVLMAGYEIAPFYKRGGLGDVMASLPKALAKEGLEVRIAVPHYAAIRQELLGNEKRIGQFYINFGKGEEEIVVYFLSNKPNLAYINTRGRNKKIDQFAFFDLAVSRFISYLSKNENWQPSIVHCNDWQTALIPLILKNKE